MSRSAAAGVVPPGALPRPFRPAWWAWNPHMQTLVGKLLRAGPDGLGLRRERWNTPDGDFLDLDFTPDPDPDAPLVVVLHGLEGNARRGYCSQLYRELGERGLAAVGVNFRSCSGEPNRRARAYHSGETDDLRFVLAGLRERFPDRPLGAVGFSLGGNVLLKYLGEPAADGEAGVLAAVAISVPYDLDAGATRLERTLLGRRLYTRYFLRSLLGKIRDKEHLLSDRIDLEALSRARTIRSFDDLATAPVHGFSGAGEYYRLSSSAGFLPEVRVPTLLLHAMDDPFLPPEAVPVDTIAANPWLHPVITARGGHVGFVTGSPAAPRFWGEASAARFLAGVLPAA